MTDVKMWWIRARHELAKRAAWLLPRRVVMWAFIRVGAHATTGHYANTVVPELSMMDALGRWPTGE